MARYWMTPTAGEHYRKAVSDTKDKWGIVQAEKYRIALKRGFQYIAEKHQSFNSSHRQGLAEGTEFSLHLVEHRYVVFQKYDDGVIIAGIFHESMDIPTRLKELQDMSKKEIDIIKKA